MVRKSEMTRGLQPALLLWPCLWGSLTVSAANPQPSSANSAGDESPPSGPEISQAGETGLEIGALTLVGTEIHLFHHLRNSPWMLGLSHIEIDDNFIIFKRFDDDQEKRHIAGPFIRYLFQPGRQASYYVSGAVYEVTHEIECDDGVSDEDSQTTAFFGAGYLGSREGRVSYHIGLQFAPDLNLDVNAGSCESGEFEGDILGTFSVVINVN